jgi:ankyrin repeat protein
LRNRSSHQTSKKKKKKKKKNFLNVDFRLIANFFFLSKFENASCLNRDKTTFESHFSTHQSLHRRHTHTLCEMSQNVTLNGGTSTANTTTTNVTTSTTTNVLAASLLSTLALHGDGERVARLLARHPHTQLDPSCVDEAGRTPLHYAVDNAVATHAIAQRAPRLLAVVDAAGWSPLHYAVARGRIDVARALLVAGASPNAAVADRDARAPLHLAAGNAHTEMLALLLDGGAFVGALDARAATPLHYAAVAGAALRPDADADAARSQAVQSSLSLLLERGAFLEARDENGETPLHWSAREAAVVALRALLDAGADAGSLSNDAESPALIAGVAKRSATIANNADELSRATRCELLVVDAVQRGAPKRTPLQAQTIFTFV